jgi:DNA-binding NarL/FixJ family response regulator
MSNIQTDLEKKQDLDNKLTAREKDMVVDSANGMSRKQIAAKYRLSAHTVRNHCANIVKKTGLANMKQVIAEYIRGNVIA